MSSHPYLRPGRWIATSLALACLLATVALAVAQSPQEAPQTASAVVLDRVVAVVNNHAILASDLQEEMRLAVLDPNQDERTSLTSKRALDQLIGRILIEQQIRQQDAQTIEVSQEEVDARLAEVRKELPVCIRQNCASDNGWKAFLATHDLTAERVETYLRYRLRILRFIELRFREGISISSKEIAAYYKDTLLPQYHSGASVPTLEQVSPRIQEILLQQQVNLLFDDWLQNLRKQGDVEVLDPSLESPLPSQTQQAGKESGR
jgi:peptidyl-prolyl cis-trans isomerase SurA